MTKALSDKNEKKAEVKNTPEANTTESESVHVTNSSTLLQINSTTTKQQKDQSLDSVTADKASTSKLSD